MTVALAIITQALRESNLIAIGIDPKAEQQTEGLSKLNQLVASVYGHEAGEGLADWPIGTEGVAETSANWSSSDWSTPPANSRMLVNSTSSQTVSFPPAPYNGARMQLIDLTGDLSSFPITLEGNGRRIEGAASIVVNVDDANIVWMYRADLGEWILLSTLEIDSDLPFHEKYDAYFETMLAMRLNPRYGRSADDQTVLMLKRSLANIRADHRQKRTITLDPAVTRMSDTGAGMAVSCTRRRQFGWMR